MKTYKTIAFVILSVFLTSKTYSRRNLSIHCGPSFPVLNFASGAIYSDDAGGAAVGLNVGLQYIYPLSESRLGVFGGIDFNYNGLQKSVQEDVENLYESLGLINADYIFYKYINIPITAGLNYTYQTERNFGVFANAGFAMNFLKMTDMEIELYGQTITTEMDLSNNIGFKIGGGILLNQRTSISFDYLGLGVHLLEGTVKTFGYSASVDTKGKIDFFTLTLAIRLL